MIGHEAQTGADMRTGDIFRGVKDQCPPTSFDLRTAEGRAVCGALEGVRDALGINQR